MKICSNKFCSQVNPQPLTNFFKKDSGKDGLNAKCKSCCKERCKIYYLNNREKLLEKYKQKYKENPEFFKHKTRENNKFNFEQRRNRLLKREFNITLEIYNKILSEQNGKCFICNKEETMFDKKANKIRCLAVDHCHSTGKVRGLLCSSCNKGLGHFKDNVELLTNAINYLKKG